MILWLWSIGFLHPKEQARIIQLAAFFWGDLLGPRNWTQVLCIAHRFFNIWASHQGSPGNGLKGLLKFRERREPWGDDRGGTESTYIPKQTGLGSDSWPLDLNIRMVAYLISCLQVKHTQGYHPTSLGTGQGPVLPCFCNKSFISTQALSLIYVGSVAFFFFFFLLHCRLHSCNRDHGLQSIKYFHLGLLEEKFSSLRWGWILFQVLQTKKAFMLGFLQVQKYLISPCLS